MFYHQSHESLSERGRFHFRKPASNTGLDRDVQPNILILILIRHGHSRRIYITKFLSVKHIDFMDGQQGLIVVMYSAFSP